MKKEKIIPAPSAEPQRRLSFWRVLLALLLVAGIGASSFFGLKQYKSLRPQVSNKPWFAPYVDVTATPAFGFEQLGTTEHKEVMLSFIVPLPSDPCTPSWGAAYTLDKAGTTLDLDRRIARLKQQGGNVSVSFGGLLNGELAVGCTDEAKLKAAYEAVINRYQIDTIDLDLENNGLVNADAGVRRAKVIADIQAERRANGKSLAVWVTLPVATQGLSEDGTNAITTLLKGKVDLAGVNAMTMDYGQSKPKGQSMLDAAKNALTQTHRQLGVLYEQAGTHLNNATLWKKLGATPMIGQNDIADEVFTLEDAEGLNKFVLSRGMVRMSMWSANRDIQCGANYVDLKVVSTSCSGVTQDKLAFATALGAGFEGTISSRAGDVTKAEPKAAQKADDPANSPYQIWSETGAYLEGTKVVWHGNVYQAKWWNQGDTPDNPVLQSWQTPWELVGPVLPGEKPIPQATVPAGTYPEWSGKSTYDTAQRVIFKGTAYQAKWWNEGQSPAAASSNPDSSPWAPLTQAQINELLEQQKKTN